MECQTIMTEFGAITPNKKNPRTITTEAMERLCVSIRRDPEFMRLRPIIVGADNVVLGGNQRFLACLKLGMRELPPGWAVKAGNLTPEQLRRFVLVDNAPEGMSGQWDFGSLSEDWDKSDLANLGFDSAVLDKVFDIPAENAKIDEETRPITLRKALEGLGDIGHTRRITPLQQVKRWGETERGGQHRERFGMLRLAWGKVAPTILKVFRQRRAFPPRRLRV